ncbi:hypothetical protein LNQ82_06670 [Conchiformibius steedae DSM 2580]|uniref:Uncharacterized protein n=1 Tax=Conchiformibius steedae DSM 2580 TaxID=1121352 RepID=A0AAE9HSL7_9NEIS|nr:hypothetical protein [Conchiformibius steedae]QMT34125.1 hypothetical protein H3L98_03750 [Conchiformibius steedae]URD66898.1 hypothetical protein LNQ82_06670 [Conchiformibius steedae DSM 2580]
MYSSLAILLANAPAVAIFQDASLVNRGAALQGFSTDDCVFLSSLAECAQLDLAELLSFASYSQQAFNHNRPLSEWLDSKQMAAALSTITHLVADMMGQLSDLRETAYSEVAFREGAQTLYPCQSIPPLSKESQS